MDGSKVTEFPCPQCGKGLRVASEAAGKRVRCPRCDTRAVVPVSPESEDEVAEPRARTPAGTARRGRPLHRDEGEETEPIARHSLLPWVAGGAIVLIALVGLTVWFATGRKPPERVGPPEVAAAPNQVSNPAESPPPPKKEPVVGGKGRSPLLPPKVSIKGPESTELLANSDLSLELVGTAPDGGDLRYEYRTSEMGEWRPLPGNRLTLADVQVGELMVQIRVLNKENLASAVVARRWTVKQPNRAPKVELLSIASGEPQSGDEMTVQIKGIDPDGDVVRYEFRTDPAAAWQRSDDGRARLAKVAAGRLVVEARAIDAIGLASEPLSQAWLVPVRKLDGHGAPVSDIAVTPDGRWAVSTSWDGTVRVWDLSTGVEVRRVTKHDGPVECLTLSPDGARVLSGGGPGKSSFAKGGSPFPLLQSDGGTVEVQKPFFRTRNSPLLLWNREDGKILRQYPGFGRSVSGLEFARDGQSFVACSSTEAKPGLYIGRTDTPEPIWKITDFDAPKSASFALNGKQLFTYDINFYGRDVTTGKKLNEWKGPRDQPFPGSFCTFSNDQKLALFNRNDHSILLWDVQAEKEVRSLSGHRAEVSALAISPDGKRAASGSTDCTIRVWDLAEGRSIAVVRGHRAPVVCVRFTPDGRSILAGDADGGLRQWAVPDSGPVPDDVKVPGLADDVLTLTRKDKLPVVAFRPRFVTEIGKDEGVRVYVFAGMLLSTPLDGDVISSRKSGTVAPNPLGGGVMVYSELTKRYDDGSVGRLGRLFEIDLPDSGELPGGGIVSVPLSSGSSRLDWSSYDPGVALYAAVGVYRKKDPNHAFVRFLTPVYRRTFRLAALN